MKLLVTKGATSYLIAIFIRDSSSATGAGLTGLTSGSSNLVCYRARSDDGNAAGTQINLSGGTRGTWSSGGFVEKDATNMPGVYELGIPNAAVASGSNYCIIMLKGATNMAPLTLELQLVEWNPQNADLGILDETSGIETNLTVRQGLRLFAAALLGKASGLATTTAVFRDTNDTKNRISATVDANGNRSAVTLDGT